ncbi:MAG: hypothetical protein HY508_04040 [Acidobacteria bacterium]|nr:hypothetical protein [Acidobacteriota bacterium]
MRLQVWVSLVAVYLISGATATAEVPQRMASSSAHVMDWSLPLSGLQDSPPLYAQVWPSFGYPSYLQPYNTTPHFPYLYFYEQYAREAEESRRAADEYEASLAREGKLTGPLEVGAFKTDFLPRSPLRLPLTLDGQAVSPSPGGAPLVIESGEHKLRVGADADKTGK